MTILTVNFVIFLGVLGIGILSYNILKGPDRIKPPGPRRFPLIGNLLQMPVDTPWLTFSDWRKEYGDVIHVDVLGKPILIVNSAQIAKELLDKRSSIYSDRPRLAMAGLAGFDQALVLQPYGDAWKEQRKIISREFSQGTVPRYHPLQEKEARILVRNALHEPASQNLKSQIQLRIARIIIRVTYGYYIENEQDPFLTLPLQTMENFIKATAPGNFMVNFVPSLKYLPPWIPGAGFLTTAAEWRKLLRDTSWNPYLWSKEHIETGETLMPNLCGTFLQDVVGELSSDAEDCLVWVAGSTMGGGLNTSISTVLSFFLAMVLHPEVQRKAQAEIDAVVGCDRLPNISDRDSLPYVRSLVAETFRWSPAIPLGILHTVTQDDIYNGIFIEKGTSIMPNVWEMLHDPSVYSDPAAFNPDRYGLADSEMQKVTDLAFGFGRRACPGHHFALGTFYAIVLTTLATCDILPALDEHGKEVIPGAKLLSGTISYPEPFKLRLRSRSSHAEAMLADTPDSGEFY